MADERQSNGTTADIENGNIKVEQITISKKAPLFILFSYGGGGAADFLAAAKYKKERLIKKYPDAIVQIIDKFKYVHEFKAEWTALYQRLCAADLLIEQANTLTRSIEEKQKALTVTILTSEQKQTLETETLQLQQQLDAVVLQQNIIKSQPRCHLWEVHYFGHGGPDYLNFQKFEGKDSLTLDDIKALEVLPWHPNNGIFVLHSCRGAAFEDTFDVKKIKNHVCLAKQISLSQNTRCLGQVVYANFNALAIDAGDGRLYSKNDRMKYRTDRYVNKVRSMLWFDSVLWGYALLTGDTGKKILKSKQKYEITKAIQNDIDLPNEYPIYQEVRTLADNNQILPCRVFNHGKLEPERIVAVDQFNHHDLDYI